MGNKSDYDGYRSYQYLTKGNDYESFDFPDEMNAGGPAYEVPLSSEDEARYNRIADDFMTISLHEHPFKLVTREPADTFEYLAQGRSEVAYDYLARSNLDVIFDFHSAGLARMHSNSGWKFSEIVHDLCMRASDLAHQDFVVPARSVEDIQRTRSEGNLAFVAAMESSAPIENELDRIDLLFGLGVRLMGITYNESNTLGTGVGDGVSSDSGLTNFGIGAVERMNKLGMLISGSHASDLTVQNACDVTNDPIILSHDGARALHETDRNKPDEVLSAVAETGGLIGVQGAPHETVSPNHPVHTIESVMDHFEYILDLVGIEHVTFGLDTTYGDHGALHRLEGARVPDSIPEVDYVKGVENPTEGWHNIVRWLVANNYSDDEIRKVLGGNTLRVLREVWP